MDAQVHERGAGIGAEIIRLLGDPARLAVLQSYGVLDTGSEPVFDDIALLAAQICETRVALVGVVDSDRQVFKGRAGWDVADAALDDSLCALAIAEVGSLVVADLAADRRTQRHPLVAGSPFYRFYAGAALRTGEGHVLGTLCVLDDRPRPDGLGAAQTAALEALARQVMAQLDQRRAVAEREALLAGQRRMVAQQAALVATQDAVSGAAGDMEAILDALVVGAMTAIGAAEGGVIQTPVGDHLLYRSAHGTLKPFAGLRVPLDGSLAGACFLSGEPLLCHDTLLDPRTTPALVAQVSARSCLVVPVSRAGEVIGVLKLQSSRTDAFTADDLAAVRLFAGVASAGFAEASDADSRRAAQASEGRYRAVFDSAIDFAIIVMDLRGQVIDWNEGAVRALGWSRDEMVGRPASTFFTAEDRADAMPEREMRAALLDGRGVDERWLLRRDGSRFWANGEMMTLRSGDGAAIGFLKILRDRTAQHEAEERILASERRLRFERGLLQAVVRQAPVGISIAFADGEQPLVNARLTAMLGTPAAAAAIDGERRAHARSALDGAITRALRDGDLLSNEVVRHEQESGEVRHWTVSSTPIADDDGRVVAAVSIVVDVEDQRRAVQALQASEERLAFAFAASGSMGWWDWDIRQDRVFASASFARLYGVDPLVAATDGLPIAAFLESIHPEDRDQVRLDIEEAIAGGQDYGAEYRLLQGETVTWVYARGRCFRDASGAPVRFPGVTLDITARKAIEAAAAARQAELRTVLETVPVGILLAEAPSGRIVMANDRLESILGHPTIMAASHAGYDGYVAHHEGGARVRADEWPLAQITQGLCDRAALEVRYRRPSGQGVWIGVSGEAIKDAAGHTVGAVIAVVDIEERKRAEANQLLLNTELSHRMKNTLAMVQAVAAQTLRNAADLVSARDALDTRLIALGRAHDILMAGDAVGADVQAVIAGAMALHDDGQGRLSVGGPALSIAPSAALSLGLIVHELATNAAKYGALSVPDGRVSLAWTVGEADDGESFTLVWAETGGPTVVPPTRRGFGTRLIERGFGSLPGNGVALAYRPEGFACTLSVPVQRLRAPGDQAG